MTTRTFVIALALVTLGACSSQKKVIDETVKELGFLYTIIESDKTPCPNVIELLTGYDYAHKKVVYDPLKQKMNDAGLDAVRKGVVSRLKARHDAAWTRLTKRCPGQAGVIATSFRATLDSVLSSAPPELSFKTK